MARTLTPETVAIVKATGPALQKHGVEITTRMYERLFIFSEVRDLFDMAAQDSGEQPRRLAAAILGYAQNIDKLENLTGAVQRMVTRHVETGVKAEHYPTSPRRCCRRSATCLAKRWLPMPCSMPGAKPTGSLPTC